MTTRDITPADDTPRTLDTLKAIQSGAIDPTTLSPETRRRLVAYLISDGYSTVDMAEVLKVSERTIERDRKAIRQTNALQPDPELPDQMAGRLTAEADLAIQRIRKAGRDKRTRPGEKIQAERECFNIINEMIQRLQSLGHLPTAAQKLEAAVLHMGEIPSLTDLATEFARLKNIASAVADQDPALLTQLDELEAATHRADLAIQAGELADTITNTEGEDDE